MKLLSVKSTADSGDVRALVEIQTQDGDTIAARIVKRSGARAYLDTQPHTLSHRDKRHLQREAVTLWADQNADTLQGLLLSERVFNGSRFGSLGVQLKAFCPVCDRNTASEFSETDNGKIRNACFYCGTLRKGRPFISRAEYNRIQDLTNACKSTGGTHDNTDAC